jgi:hypothetical protein
LKTLINSKKKKKKEEGVKKATKFADRPSDIEEAQQSFTPGDGRARAKRERERERERKNL